MRLTGRITELLWSVAEAEVVVLGEVMASNASRGNE